MWDEPSLIDHAAGRRSASEVAAAWRDPSARLLIMNQHGAFEADQGFDTPASGQLDDDTVFLGWVAGAPWFARGGEPAHPVDIRQTHLAPAEHQLATAAMAVLTWRRHTIRCPLCGGPLQPADGGYSSLCPACGHQTFPRQDPAVICAVLDGEDRLYLAHNVTWEPGRVSILAGFVEAGESLEGAVHRELAEEAHLRLSQLRYYGSQPWPFPRSLMLAFVARAQSGGQADGVELAWGRWFTPERVRSEMSDGRLLLPPPASIAGRLIGEWLDGGLPAPEG